MCTATGQRKDMMYLFSCGDFVLLKTLFTQRMSSNVPVTDSLPSTPVSFLDRRVTVIFLVPFIFKELVFVAVPAVRKLGTAGM